MPIYEYKCQGCGCVFEELIPARQAEIALHCPSCHGDQLQRLISMVGFTSKGSSGEISHSSSGRSCGTCSSHACHSCH